MVRAILLASFYLGVAAWCGADDALKEPCRGLMLRECRSAPAFDFIDSVVVQLAWRELEPADQQFDGPGLELIEQIRKLGLKIRLRILGGVRAPAFVKAIGGLAGGGGAGNQSFQVSEHGFRAERVSNPHRQAVGRHGGGLI